MFIFFPLKWSEVKDLKEITKRKSRNIESPLSATSHTSSRFFDNNWPKHLNPSSLNAITTTQNEHKSDTKLVVGSVVDSISSEINRFDMEDTDLFFRFIIIDIDEN